MEVEWTDWGVRAVGADGSVAVTLDGWADSAGHSAERDPATAATATIHGSARGVSIPGTGRARRLDGGTTESLAAAGSAVRLPTGEYRVDVDGPVPTTLRFSGGGTLTDSADSVSVDFPTRTPVTVGFESARRTADPVSVPRTVEGVAAAVSQFGAAFTTTGPDRSAPSARGPFPAVAFDDAATADATGRGNGDLTLRVPAELPYLFTAAPLATYLDAEVVVEESMSPQLDLPDGTHEFPQMPAFQEQVNALLRRVFLFDCLLRGTSRTDRPLAERRVLEDLEFDPSRLADWSLAARVERYLEAPFDRVSDAVPEWHLSMYVQPTFDRVETLPSLLTDLPFVYLPVAEPLTDEEKLGRSLDEFYRAGSPHASPVVDAIKPELGAGRMHGWLADGAPIDTFKTLPEAYDHRASQRSSARPLSVVSVINDPAMDAEYDSLAARSDRLGNVGVDVTVKRRVTRRELAEVFAADTDLVHYVGHNEEAGLRCADGHLSAADLETVNAETFLLNACGSYYEGVELIRKGSVAGAVTFNKVLDGHAARVGATFVRLLLCGFSLERALDLARRRIMTGKDYTVVGDGTHRVRETADREPVDAVLEQQGDDKFTLTLRVDDPRQFGAVHDSDLLPDARPTLFGTEQSATLTRRELQETLSRVDVPVVFEGDIHWTTDLVDRFRPDSESPGTDLADPAD
jgi:hypothetical protein